MERLADAGLLRMSIDEAIAVTTGMAIGCVIQLFAPAEEALLRQWLRTLTEHFEQAPTTPRPASEGREQ